MTSEPPSLQQGLDALRRALAAAAPGPRPRLAVAGLPSGAATSVLASVETPRGRAEGLHVHAQPGPRSATGPPRQATAATAATGEGQATSSAEDPEVAARLIDLVERAREGDADAFGALFDHYHRQVYRFVYYRTGSVPLAEDLTSEAFVRALRNITSFTWQGRDFGAWLTTIARNLVADHYKSARNRLEQPVEDERVLDSATEGPESEVLAQLTNEVLLEAVRTLPEEQQTCIVLRFLQGRSIAEVAAALGRSEGAVKQLQLRAVRNLAKRMPEELR